MPDASTHRHMHAVLLLQKLLSFKPGASPFTLILDSLEQSARPVVAECILRAKASKATTILLSGERVPAPSGTDHVVALRGKDASTLQKTTSSLLCPSGPNLVVIDTLHPLLLLRDASLAAFLSQLANPATTSVLAVYHTDVPLPSTLSLNPYAPPPLTLLSTLATTLITPHSLPHSLATHRAALRSRAVLPVGLEEGIDGVLQSLDANGGTWTDPETGAQLRRGVVLDIEHRRRSGRSVATRAFLPLAGEGEPERPQKIGLLEEHPLFAAPVDRGSKDDEDPALAAATFSLTLTERQRQERDGVVLPYYDAQREDGVGGWGHGGRILYQMGAEDAADWDSEEDEL